MDFFGDQDPMMGPGGFFAQIAQNFGGNFASNMPRPPSRPYDDFLKAYSVAMLPGRERTNLSYGGKIIMPPSALANLTNLDLDSPWMFRLRNPSNSAVLTHAGVLEFIAEEGVVHLPYWMMKTLRLNEGDPIRITSTELPKGKFVKLQAQSVHFLDISDPKAVLEHALRNFSALTQGDIIEISYNSIIFGLLVMEATPGGEGISVLDTDLEVDFAPPVGYVEPERPKAAPPSTMASKLKIDLNSSSPGSSRPSSALSGGFKINTGTVVSKGGDQWESFKGKGATLGGRKTKGKGISHKKVEEVAAGSKIIRTDQRRIVSNSTLESNVKVPAALNLPFGQLFFGFRVAAYTPPASNSPSAADPPEPANFSGTGYALNDRRNHIQAPSNGKGKEKEKEKEKEDASEEAPASWGAGRTLRSSRVSVQPDRPNPGENSRVPNSRTGKAEKAHKTRSPSPDWGVDDDDVIMIDSD